MGLFIIPGEIILAILIKYAKVGSNVLPVKSYRHFVRTEDPIYNINDIQIPNERYK